LRTKEPGLVFSLVYTLVIRYTIFDTRYRCPLPLRPEVFLGEASLGLMLNLRRATQRMQKSALPPPLLPLCRVPNLSCHSPRAWFMTRRRRQLKIREMCDKRERSRLSGDTSLSSPAMVRIRQPFMPHPRNIALTAPVSRCSSPPDYLYFKRTAGSETMSSCGVCMCSCGVLLGPLRRYLVVPFSVYVCMYIRMYVYTYVCMYVCIRIYMLRPN
jgi:hypothetical protein